MASFPPVLPTAEPLPERSRRLLDEGRDEAERQMNRLRLGVLALLALAAVAYAPSLPARLNLLNAATLAPMLAWAAGQALLFRHLTRLPHWLPAANPVVDLTAVTTIMLGYGLAQTPALALKSPMFLGYFAVLAARPIASSTRIAALASVLAFGEYALLVAAMVAHGGLVLADTPVAASTGPGIALLDEGAKLVFLAVGGAVATYATAWHERMALAYSREAHDRELTETRLVQARLEGLRRQLQPHFLFNALNTIMALIATDPRAAERVTGRLSELLRASLHDADAQRVPLARELEVLQPYLDIQQIRFRDRLTIAVDVDADVRTALVPSLVLQPLVENAIRHGVAPRASAGRVLVRAARDGDRLRLRVEDDGVGLRGGTAVRDGVGLGNTRARLRHLYGDAGQLTYAAPSGGGFHVSIDIPYAVDAAAAGGPDRA